MALGCLDTRHYTEGPRSDEQERVTFPSVIPGATYRLPGAAMDITAEAGKTIELPDARAN